MPRREPERSGITWNDVYLVMGTYRADYGVLPMFQVVYLDAPTPRTYVEVVLHPAGVIGGGAELVRVRGEFDMRKAAGHAGAVMHALYTAINEYDRNPWLWTPERRALVTGETL